MYSRIKCLIICKALMYLLSTASSTNLSLTQAEAISLKELSNEVEDVLTHAYMKEDMYLIRYLRTANSDVKLASKMIHSTMKWRSSNRIDGIVEEENPMDREFPCKFGLDKFGGTAPLINIREIDFRKAAVRDKRDQAARAVWKVFEVLATKLRASNSYQGVMIIDISGFSYRKHACKECIIFAHTMANSVEANYPGYAGAVFCLNTPRAYEVFINIVKVYLSAPTRNALQVYGYDKSEWMNGLLKWFTLDQLHDLLGHNFTVYLNGDNNSYNHGNATELQRKPMLSYNRFQNKVLSSNSDVTTGKLVTHLFFILLAQVTILSIY